MAWAHEDGGAGSTVPRRVVQSAGLSSAAAATTATATTLPICGVMTVDAFEDLPTWDPMVLHYGRSLQRVCYNGGDVHDASVFPRVRRFIETIRRLSGGSQLSADATVAAAILRGGHSHDRRPLPAALAKDRQPGNPVVCYLLAQYWQGATHDPAALSIADLDAFATAAPVLDACRSGGTALKAVLAHSAMIKGHGARVTRLYAMQSEAATDIMARHQEKPFSIPDVPQAFVPHLWNPTWKVKVVEELWRTSEVGNDRLALLQRLPRTAIGEIMGMVCPLTCPPHLLGVEESDGADTETHFGVGGSHSLRAHARTVQCTEGGAAATATAGAATSTGASIRTTHGDDGTGTIPVLDAVCSAACDEASATAVRDGVALGGDAGSCVRIEMPAKVRGVVKYFVTTALEQAAYRGFTETVSTLVELGVDVNAVDEDGTPALAYAAAGGHTETVAALARAGAALNAADTWVLCFTPLIWAARNGHAPTVKALVDAGAALDAVDAAGRTALSHCVEHGHIDAARILVAAGAAHWCADETGTTALMWAAEYEHIAAVLVLLEAGADVDASDCGGQTALIAAASGGCIDIVQAMLDAGGDVHATCNVGRTALSCAAEQGHAPVAALLMDAGADVDIADSYGCTAVYRAVERGHTDVVTLLVAAGADLGMHPEAMMSPLCCAVGRERAAAVNALLAAGPRVDIDARGASGSMKGCTALAYAADYGMTGIVDSLLRAGADINVANDYGWTPMMRAAQRGSEDAVKLLLGAGPHKADVEASLREATVHRQGAVVELLRRHLGSADALTGAGSV